MLLRQADNLLKSRRIPDGHVRQDFPIQRYVGLCKGVDKTAVGQSMVAHRGTDAGDPETAKIPLSVLPSDICIGQPLVYTLCRCAEQSASSAILSFG